MKNASELRLNSVWSCRAEPDRMTAYGIPLTLTQLPLQALGGAACREGEGRAACMGREGAEGRGV